MYWWPGGIQPVKGVIQNKAVVGVEVVSWAVVTSLYALALHEMMLEVATPEEEM